MYKKFEKPLRSKYRRYVGKGANLNLGAAEIGDIVTFETEEKVVFQIKTERSSDDSIQGEIVGINNGSNPITEFEGWSLEEKIEVAESAINAIIRKIA